MTSSLAARLSIRRSSQQTLGTQVLVDVRPVDSKPGTCQPPVRPLLRSGMEQTGVPDEGYGDRAAVGEADGELVVGEAHVLDAKARVQGRGGHS